VVARRRRENPKGNTTTSGVFPWKAAGHSGLTYDALTDRYTYVRKTERSWVGTCRQLVVKLDDGTTHVADFQLS
jgi:hypothetical protein